MSTPGQPFVRSYTYKIWIHYDGMPQFLTWYGPALEVGPALVHIGWDAQGVTKKLYRRWLRIEHTEEGNRLAVLPPKEINLEDFNLEVRQNTFTPGKALQIFLYIPPHGGYGPPIALIQHAFKQRNRCVDQDAPMIKYDRAGLGLPAFEENPGIVFYVKVDNAVGNPFTQVPSSQLNPMRLDPISTQSVRAEIPTEVALLLPRKRQFFIDLTLTDDEEQSKA